MSGKMQNVKYNEDYYEGYYPIEEDLDINLKSDFAISEEKNNLVKQFLSYAFMVVDDEFGKYNYKQIIHNQYIQPYKYNCIGFWQKSNDIKHLSSERFSYITKWFNHLDKRMGNLLIANPISNNVGIIGVLGMGKEKSDEELFREAYESVNADDASTIDTDSFIKYCEELYEMTTDKFLEWFIGQGEEGNVDMQLWASIAKDRVYTNGRANSEAK